MWTASESLQRYQNRLATELSASQQLGDDRPQWERDDDSAGGDFFLLFLIAQSRNVPDVKVQHERVVGQFDKLTHYPASRPVERYPARR